MECLQIDWKNIDDTFVKDEFYESIQAPKWIDFMAPFQPVDDHAWFCGKVGCTHERKVFFHELDQGSTSSIDSEASAVAPTVVSALMEKTASNSGAVKRARGLVSSSLSSLSDIKQAVYAKNKVLHHAQMPCIAEAKGNTVKNSRQPQASENENPNRACKVQEAACRKTMLRAPDGIGKKMKMSDCKELGVKEARAPVLSREVPARVFKMGNSTLSEKTNHSQTKPVSEVSKSTILFGKRDPVHIKSTLIKTSVKDHISTFNGMAEASRIKKDEAAIHTFRAHSSRPVAMPSVRRSAVVIRSLHGVCSGSEKVAASRPPRVVALKDSKPYQPCCIKNEKDAEVLTRKLIPEKDPQKAEDSILQRDNQKSEEIAGIMAIESGVCQPQCDESDVVIKTALMPGPEKQREFIEASVQVQEQCPIGKVALPNEAPCIKEEQPPPPPLPVVKVESTGNDIQMREKEDSIQNALETFLENLRLTSPEDDEKRKRPSSALEMAASDALEHEIGLSSHEDIASEQEMVQSMRCSSQSDDIPQDGTNAMQVNSDNTVGTDHEVAPPMNDEGSRHGRQKQDVKFMKEWQRNRGMKRKSSELNFKVNCSGRNHKLESRKAPSTLASSMLFQQFKQLSTVKLPSAQGPDDTCEEQHKKIKTSVVQTFKPFRLRTEERGALKELGHGSREAGAPNPQELVHHALRMPSFGHPFRPQRSTKKLTIPREPKFHPSRTKRACIRQHATTHTELLSS